MVTVSPDNLEQTQRLKAAKDLGMIMLSDPELKIIDKFNLRHPDALAPTPKEGIRRPLAIPTTFFVNGNGIVEWIDQADDYRIRSDADRVLAAVKDSLDGQAGAKN